MAVAPDSSATNLAIMHFNFVSFPVCFGRQPARNELRYTIYDCSN
jgi:hypothetical protein